MIIRNRIVKSNKNIKSTCVYILLSLLRTYTCTCTRYSQGGGFFSTLNIINIEGIQKSSKTGIFLGLPPPPNTFNLLPMLNINACKLYALFVCFICLRIFKFNQIWKGGGGSKTYFNPPPSTYRFNEGRHLSFLVNRKNGLYLIYLIHVSTFTISFKSIIRMTFLLFRNNDNANTMYIYTRLL